MPLAETRRARSQKSRKGEISSCEKNFTIASKISYKRVSLIPFRLCHGNCFNWCENLIYDICYLIEGVDDLKLHHLYRAMAFLGEETVDQKDATPFSPRCTKDLIEEALFFHRRNLLSGLDLVFFDTTSIYFEGRGGKTIGQRGFSKDHRPDLKQMVVGAVINETGQPICCEMWPGNTTDVKTLIPVIERLQKRFPIKRVCIVADRGMISSKIPT